MSIMMLKRQLFMFSDLIAADLIKKLTNYFISQLFVLILYCLSLTVNISN